MPKTGEAMSISVERISRRAGVGRATAYRVLGGHANVSAETRAKVMRAVEELGYPQMRPRGSRGRGVVLWGPLLNGVAPETFFPEVREALVAAMARRGRALATISCPVPESTDELPLELLRENIEGILTVAFYSEQHLRAMARRWPMACLLSSRAIPGAVSLTPDFADAARQAIEHLLARGHRRVALVTGKVQPWNASRLLLEGYAGALAQAGLKLDPALVHSDWSNLGRVSPEKTLPLAVGAGRDLLGRAERPTAIIAREDSIPGIRVAAAELGLGVPQDVSLVTVGPRRAEREVTALEFSLQDMVELALRAIGSAPAEGARILLPVTLREGGSVREL